MLVIVVLGVGPCIAEECLTLQPQATDISISLSPNDVPHMAIGCLGTTWCCYWCRLFPNLHWCKLIPGISALYQKRPCLKQLVVLAVVSIIALAHYYYFFIYHSGLVSQLLYNLQFDGFLSAVLDYIVFTYKLRPHCFLDMCLERSRCASRPLFFFH